LKDKFAQMLPVPCQLKRRRTEELLADEHVERAAPRILAQQLPRHQRQRIE